MKTEKPRNANYKLLEVNKLFVPALNGATLNGTCGNIQEQIEPRLEDVKADIEAYDKRLSGQGAPIVLSRLIALFEGLQIETCGQSAYKITWNVILVHPETGHLVTFYDYKGGISYGSDIFGKETPKSFIRDLKKLIEVLKDSRCPHPYDGCVVGEAA